MPIVPVIMNDPSSYEAFWKAVENWCISKSKPTIRVEATAEGSNWPTAIFSGRVDSFTMGESITFALDDGQIRTVELRNCSLRVVTIPKDLSELNVLARFSLECDDEGGTVSCFVFTEMRDWGTPD